MHHNLSPVWGGLYGRQDELDWLRQAWSDGQAPIALVGPPGVGKTRLASAFALALKDGPQAPPWVWFVDLRSARTTERLIEVLDTHLAEISEVQAPQGRKGLLLRYASLERGLLILDNLEQVQQPADRLCEELWASNARVQLLLTSRLESENRDWRRLTLRPLDVGDRQPRQPREIRELGAVKLFIEQVERVRAMPYQPDVEELEAILAVVELLEGSPLAIELAASRMQLLDAQAMASRLDLRLGLLERTVPGSGHISLRETIAWSRELLSAPTRRLWEFCAVFRGGFDVEAAEAIMGHLDEQEMGQSVVLAQLEELQRHSLLHMQWHQRRRRLQMSESMREFAEESLQGRAALEQAWRAHARYYATRGYQLTRRVQEERGALPWLKQERENLFVVLERFPDPGDEELLEWVASAAAALSALAMLNMAGALPRSLLTRLTERLRQESAIDVRLRARVMQASYNAALAEGDFASFERQALALEALGIEEEEAFTQAMALTSLGNVTRQRGELPEAIAFFERAVIALEEADRPVARARVMTNLALSLAELGRFERVEDLYLESLSVLRESGMRISLGNASLNLSLHYQSLGQVERSQEMLAQAEELYTQLEYRARGCRAKIQRLFIWLNGLPVLDVQQEECEQLYEEILAEVEQFGDQEMRLMATNNFAQYLQQLPEESSRARALSLMEGCYEELRDEGLGSIQSMMVQNVGLSNVFLGRQESALGFFEESVELELGRSKTRAAESLAWSAALLVAQAQNQRAAELAQRAVELARRARSIDSSDGVNPVHWEIAALCAFALGDDALPQALVELLRPRESLGDHNLAQVRLESRVLIKLLDGQLERALKRQVLAQVVDPLKELLLFDVDAGRFRLPGESAWEELEHRPQLMILVRALMTAPEEGISTVDLIDWLFPDQQLTFDSATNRVYVALSQLRGMGLKPYLGKGAEGYRIEGPWHQLPQGLFDLCAPPWWGARARGG